MQSLFELNNHVMTKAETKKLFGISYTYKIDQITTKYRINLQNA